MSEWVKVAQFSDLADKEMKAVREKGEHIAVVQAEGQVYAFEDYCTHAFCSFTPGEVEEDGEVLCLCHLAKFKYSTGEVIWGPAYMPLKIFPVRVEGDDVFVEI